MEYELGIIGAGNMAEAIVKAVVDNQIIAPRKIIVSDPVPQRRAIFEAMGVLAVDSNLQVITRSSQVMLAVKPQMLKALGEELRQIDPERQIVLSIMAGVRSPKINELAGKTLRVIRIMPNTPLMVGRGMSGIARGEGSREGDELVAMQIFRAAGEAVTVREEDIDAVTAVSGSGPAYVFYLAEAMMEAATSLELSPGAARLLTQQTILGAAELLVKSGEPADVLRRKVTSPGGTTQAAIEHMESKQVRQHIADAVRAAAARSRELGK
jgi:pyrroline-5-carboxylate reductase